MCLVTPPKKVLETGEMLNMLNVWVFLAEFPPKHLTHLTCLTFPLFRALSFRGPPNTFNIFNISPVLSVFWLFLLYFPCFVDLGSRNRGNVKCFLPKMLKTGEMLNRLNVWLFLAEFPPKHLTHLTYLTFPLFRALFFRGPPNTFNIFNISPVLSVFLIFLLYFPCFVDLRSRNRGNVKCFLPKMLKTGEMLNMLNVWVFLAKFSPKHLTLLTYLTFPLFRAFFLGGHQTHLTYLTFPLFLSVFWVLTLHFPFFADRCSRNSKNVEYFNYLLAF